MSPSNFLDELRQGLDRCCVRDESIVVAVSGGADSVALLVGLYELRNELGLELIVAHLNHALRGDESDGDAEWVTQLASELKLPVESMRLSETTWDRGSGMEETARRLRYEYFDQVAAKYDARTIAVAHTADDQAETVLHNITRGTGIAGVRGMQRVRATKSGHRLIRPMLSIRRSTLESFLAEGNQSFRTDSTNIDLQITRNRIRHTVMPLMREQLNSQVETALCRLAEQASEVDEIMDVAVESLLECCVQHSHLDTCHLDVSVLRNKPRHLVRHLFRTIWSRQKWPLKSMGFEEWNRLADLLDSKKTITLPDRIEARFRTDTLLVLRRLQAANEPSEANVASINPPSPTH